MSAMGPSLRRIAASLTRCGSEARDLAMDFYIAAIGRSGSTALANWLTTPPTHVVFHEPNLLRDRPTRLLGMQLADWGMTREQVMAGHWAAKETQTLLHHGMIDRFRPAKVLVSVRKIGDAALSLFEKHRRQALLDRYSDEWVADYLTREAEGLVRFAERLDEERIPWALVRFEELSPERMESVADWLGWPGAGTMSRGLEAFGRGFEAARTRDRELPAEVVALAATIAGRCSAFDRRFYPS